MKRLTFALLAAAALCAAMPTRAHAAYLITLSQTGGNVVINGSGSLNTTALTPAGTFSFGPAIYTQSAIIANGSGASVYGNVTGPTSFGTGNSFNATSSTGSLFGLYGAAHYVFTPANYVSGTAFTGTQTYNGATFATLGFTPGTYTYTWGTGATADSLVVTSVVPEPSTWALLGVGVAGLGVVTLRRRRTVRA